MNIKDRIRKKAKEKSTSSVGGGLFDFSKAGIEEVEFWSPDKADSYKFDIIPYKVTDSNNLDEVPAGEEWYRKLLLVHYKVGPMRKNVVCPRSIGRNCPICEAVSEAYENGDNDAAKEIKASRRTLMNVFFPESDDNEIKLFFFSAYNFVDVLEREVGDSEMFNFADPEDGLTIKARFAEEHAFGNPYYECDRVDFIERDQQYDPEVVQDAIPLDEIINVLSYDELKTVLYGAEVVDESEEEEDDLPYEKPKTIVVSNEPEEKEEKEEKEPVVEEEKPKRPRRPVRRAR